MVPKILGHQEKYASSFSGSSFAKNCSPVYAGSFEPRDLFLGHKGEYALDMRQRIATAYPPNCRLPGFLERCCIKP